MNNKEKLPKIEKIFLTAAAVLVVLAGAVSGYINSEIRNYSGIDNLKKFQPSIPTRLYDVNGELIAELFQEKRDLEIFENLPPSLINAFLAAEDKDFYQHFGINPMAVIRAMGKNFIASVKAFRPVVVQGGSTITQQLAKRLFTDSERTFARKAFEAVLALQIEKKFSKDEILEMYFNQIYLGHGCHGISAASRFFFNKDVKYLSVMESSVLAALPSKPVGYSPLREPRDAMEKNRDTLRRMAECGFIKKNDADRMYEEFWPGFIDSIKTEFPTKTAVSSESNRAPYFVDYVRQILLARFGKDVVYNEGLSVFTTLDLKRQLIAQKYMEEGLARQNEVSSKANTMYSSSLDRSLFTAYNQMRLIFSLPGMQTNTDLETITRKHLADSTVDSLDLLTLFTGIDPANDAALVFRNETSGIVADTLKVEGAFIAIEPGTGYITSMIGGSEYSVSNQYNRAVQARRQPGSSFKPYVYGSAIEARKINPGTALSDAPIMDIDAAGEIWSPGNYEGDFSGLVRIRRALSASINIISIRIFDMMGAEAITDYASKMTKVPLSRFAAGPSLALGVSELTPLEQATGYSIYANGGRDVIPFAVRYVEDRDGNEMANIEEEIGRIIAIKEMNGTNQIISPEVDYVMTSLMQSVIDSGTANDSIRKRAGFTNPAAGKTGTTTNWTDAWFCGYTPDIAAVVWIGYDKPFLSLGKHQSGSGVAAPIWANYMRDIYRAGMSESQFPPQPEGVYKGTVCKYTGLIPSDKCTELIGEIMIRGSGPTQVCNGEHYAMKTVLDRYLEKEGLKEE